MNAATIKVKAEAAASAFCFTGGSVKYVREESLLMKFSQLAKFLEKLEKTASRNEITLILAELFNKAGAEEIDKICYLSLGELLPGFRGVEFQLAEKMMIRILSEAFKETSEKIRKLYQESGDLGNVAEALAKKGDRRDLSVSQVYDRLLEIAVESGGGSQERKTKKMAGLLTDIGPLSARYVARIPVSKLRLGFSDATILDAFSVMERGDKSGRKEIERAFNITADIGLIAKKVKSSGIKALAKIAAQPGIPIRPSLAERVSTAKEIIDKLGPRVAVEPKFDGFRVEIHAWCEKGKKPSFAKATAGKNVMLFSRNLENTTHMFPEIAEGARKLKVKSIILDGEAIGYNQKTGKFMLFQETVQRKRKYGIEEMVKKIPLAVFVFDILYLNGKSMLEAPFAARRKVLEKVFAGYRGSLHLADQIYTDDPDVISQELKKSLAKGLEGLVVKNPDLPYEAGTRGFHWAKLKAGAAALAGARAGKKILLDTVDCLVMGAYRGKGKRAEFGVGGFLLGVKDKDDRFYTISKLGTGISDEQFHEARKRIKKLEAAECPKEYAVIKKGIPDIWIKPSLVAEVISDEITLSPRHTAGNPAFAKASAGKKGERGYSLRFPRLVRFRDDKNPEDATTVAEVEKMYKAQGKK